MKTYIRFIENVYTFFLNLLLVLYRADNQ